MTGREKARRRNAPPTLRVLNGALAVEAGGTELPLALHISTTGGVDMRVNRWRANGGVAQGSCDGFAVTCEPDSLNGGLSLSFTLQREGRGFIALQSARVSLAVSELSSGDAATALRIAYCGAFSRSEDSRSYARALGPTETLTSWWVGALASDRSVVLGALDFRQFATSVDHARGRISANQHLENWMVSAGGSLALAPVWIALSEGAPFDALESYATAVGAVHGVVPARPVCGWGTWGHYLEEIDAGLLRETVMTLDGIGAASKQIQVVQIDDGWSEMLSTGKVSASWRPNRRFPSGIAPLAAEIVESGRDCGLWMLPFTVNEGSSLAEDHPEFLVHDADGQLLRVGGGGSYCIDPTNAGAADWLTGLFGEVRDWGVRYLKLDFLRALLSPEPSQDVDGIAAPRRYAGAQTRVQAYRRGLEIIRAAMGRDAYLLGCSAPGGPSVGLVTAHRVGPDIEPHWVGRLSGVRDASRAIAANWFWNGRTWINDPDYLVPCESENVTRFWAAVVALSGGSMILSADLSEMDTWLEELFAFVAPPIGIAARPVDLFERGPEPQIWQLPLSKDGSSWQVIGVFNWSDEPGDIALDLGQLGFGDAPVHLWDAFRQRHRIATGKTSVWVEPRSVVLLRATAAGSRPLVIGTDVHFGQGYLEIASESWDASTGTLTITGAHRAGTAFVWSPVSPRSGADESSEYGEHVWRVPIAPGSRSTATFETRKKSARARARTRVSHT